MSLPRIGMDVPDRDTAATAIEAILRAEARGVPMMWSTLGSVRPDAMIFFAGALARTSNIKLGTAIVPTYPRHPATLYTQVLALNQMAPDRFRLGIGPSHRSAIEGELGIPMGKPLDYLREYLTVLKSLLETGKANFSGDYFNVNISGSTQNYFNVRTTGGVQAPMPIYLSALRKRAFRLAGEIADGAISWLCPVHYLNETAIPAMREGASEAGRPMPRMIAHVPVVMSDSLERVRQVAGAVLGRYAQQPFYANMFGDAGYPVGEDAQVSDELLDHLVVNGTRDTVRERLNDILETDIDELLVMLIAADNPAAEEETLSEIVAELA